jgi:AcrR family transcriptional regulator
MTAKQRRLLRTGDLARTLITESAVTIFAQKGYHGATMDEIARACGYSPSAIYKYFRNKDEVFLAVLKMITDSLLQTLDDPMPPNTPFRNRLFLIQSRVGMVIEKNLELFMAFTLSRHQVGDMVESGLCGAAAQEATAQVHERYFERVSALMQEGINAGALRPAPAEHHALAFIGIGEMFLRYWFLKREISLISLTESIINFFMDGAGQNVATDDQRRATDVR